MRNQTSHCTLYIAWLHSLAVLTLHIFLKETKMLDTSFRTITVGIVKSIIPKLYMMYTCMRVAGTCLFCLLPKGDCSCMTNTGTFLHTLYLII